MSCSCRSRRDRFEPGCDVDLGQPALDALASSQARNRAIAAPSRRCAARMPPSSTVFLRAFGSRQGSRPQTTPAPAASSRSATQTGAVAGRPHAPSQARRAPGRGVGRAPRPRCRGERDPVAELAGSMNSATRPSSSRIANASGTGVRARPRRGCSRARRSFGHRQHRRGEAAPAARGEPAACGGVAPASASGCGTRRARRRRLVGPGRGRRVATLSADLARPGAAASASTSWRCAATGHSRSGRRRAAPGQPFGRLSSRWRVIEEPGRPAPAPARGNARRRTAPRGRG